MTLTQPAIITTQITKTFRSGSRQSTVLKDVSFSLDNGSFTAITGPSGSGKSTLLTTIGGLSKPTRGSVRIFGQDIYKLGDRARSSYRNETIGFIFQDYRLIPHYTVLQNIVVPLKIAGLSGREQRKRGLTQLKSVGLESYANQRITELSGGQQQRVGIARALVTQPKLLIADEPTGNLDTKTGQDIMSLLQRIQAEHHMTLLMVTHNDALAQLADKQIVLRDGMIEGARS